MPPACMNTVQPPGNDRLVGPATWGLAESDHASLCHPGSLKRQCRDEPIWHYHGNLPGGTRIHTYFNLGKPQSFCFTAQIKPGGSMSLSTLASFTEIEFSQIFFGYFFIWRPPKYLREWWNQFSNSYNLFPHAFEQKTLGIIVKIIISCKTNEISCNL